jgi:aldose 1-epimerase
MKYSVLAFAASVSAAALGPHRGIKPDADGRYTLEAPGIRAQVIHSLVY